MLRPYLFSIHFILIQAYFDEFFFAKNSSCPGLAFSCPAPTQVCAHEQLLDKYYCCTGEEGDICWSGGITCAGSDGGPSASQQNCGSADAPWCCLATETCTETSGQVNVCWSPDKDVLGHVNNAELKSLYQSLSTQSPTAPTLKFDASSFAVAVTSTSAQTPTTSSSRATTSSSASPASSKGHSSSSSLSSGAIAGIVVGSVVAVAAIIAVVWFCLKVKKLGSGKRDSWPKPDQPATSQYTSGTPYSQDGSSMPVYAKHAPTSPEGQPGNRASGTVRHELYTRPEELP